MPQLRGGRGRRGEAESSTGRPACLSPAAGRQDAPDNPQNPLHPVQHPFALSVFSVVSPSQDSGRTAHLAFSDHSPARCLPRNPCFPVTVKITHHHIERRGRRQARYFPLCNPSLIGGENVVRGKPLRLRRGTRLPQPGGGQAGVPARETSWAGCPCHGAPRQGPFSSPLCVSAPLPRGGGVTFPFSSCLPQVPTPPRLRDYERGQKLLDFHTGTGDKKPDETIAGKSPPVPPHSCDAFAGKRLRYSHRPGTLRSQGCAAKDGLRLHSRIRRRTYVAAQVPQRNSEDE
jgi:hypothetical protein